MKLVFLKSYLYYRLYIAVFTVLSCYSTVCTLPHPVHTPFSTLHLPNSYQPLHYHTSISTYNPPSPPKNVVTFRRMEPLNPHITPYALKRVLIWFIHLRLGLVDVLLLLQSAT